MSLKTMGRDERGTGGRCGAERGEGLQDEIKKMRNARRRRRMSEGRVAKREHRQEKNLKRTREDSTEEKGRTDEGGKKGDNRIAL